jgi:hypothetical protein
MSPGEVSGYGYGQHEVHDTPGDGVCSARQDALGTHSCLANSGPVEWRGLLLWFNQSEAKRCLGKARGGDVATATARAAANRRYSALYTAKRANSLCGTLTNSARHFPDAGVAATLAPPPARHVSLVRTRSSVKSRDEARFTLPYINRSFPHQSHHFHPLRPPLTVQIPPPTTPSVILPIARARPRASALLPPLRFARTPIRSLGAMASEPINPEVVSRVSGVRGVSHGGPVQNDTRALS